MKTISLKLPPRLLARLEAESKIRGTTKSSVVRESLARLLDERGPNEEPSCYDVAKDLAGSIKGLPRDLATNPKYLKDFGK